MPKLDLYWIIGLGLRKAKKFMRNYEKQIDQLVYKLYGLTPEEIKIVEEQTNGK